jgi:hypothetical protein
MWSSFWRLVTLPCILLALLLIGSPEFPALARAGIVYMVERIRTRNRAAALMMMAAFDSLYATVVARNHAVGRQLQRQSGSGAII